MADTTPEKPGFWERMFGRKTAQPDKPAGPETMPRETPASRSEGEPDFTTAAAAGELPALEPGITEASPEAGDERLPAELSGASLQPVAGIETRSGGSAAAPSPGSQEERRAGLESRTSPAPESRAPASGAQAPPVSGAQAPAEPAVQAKSWWQRLADGMRRTSSSLSESVTGLFTKRRLDADTLEQLEDVLVQADLGVETARRIADAVGHGRYDKEISPQEVKAILAAEVEKALRPVAKPLSIDQSRKPFVVLVIGVNGAGKTTTIGKLAQKFRDQDLRTMLAAGDTFRAAAIEQLKIWGERTGSAVVAREQGTDAASLAFAALQEARATAADVLLVDTAGRLQNKAGLMAELEKIVRVMKKLDASAPHATLLVLDATVGQNALSQVELFRQAADVTGLVMTKLDGTARGGILVALAQKFGLPVHFIGVGEGVADLEPFEAFDFARAIAGLDD